MCIQEGSALTSSLDKEEQHILLSSDHTWNKLTAEHYEPLPGFKFCHQEESYNTSERQSLTQTVSRSKDVDATTGSNASQFSQSNNVINLKSTTQVDSNNLTLPQSWNLPMRNSFTSYNKPQIKVPKGPFS